MHAFSVRLPASAGCLAAAPLDAAGWSTGAGKPRASARSRSRDGRGAQRRGGRERERGAGVDYREGPERVLDIFRTASSSFLSNMGFRRFRHASQMRVEEEMQVGRGNKNRPVDASEASTGLDVTQYACVRALVRAHARVRQRLDASLLPKPRTRSVKTNTKCAFRARTPDLKKTRPQQ